MSFIEPGVLSGENVSLEPLRIEHAEELFETTQTDTFQYWVLLQPHDYSLDAFREFIQRTLDEPNCVSVVCRLKSSGKLVAKSSFMDIRSAAKGLEIGMTWIDATHRGTVVNPEMKLIMLEYAFENWGAIRVQLKTDRRNTHSQKAIAKLGAKLEGTLRKHGIQPNGYQRDTVMFSITDDEWPEVKRQLLDRIKKIANL